jgi:hypothetical protein
MTLTNVQEICSYILIDVLLSVSSVKEGKDFDVSGTIR